MVKLASVLDTARRLFFFFKNLSTCFPPLEAVDMIEMFHSKNGSNRLFTYRYSWVQSTQYSTVVSEKREKALVFLIVLCVSSYR